MYIRDRGHQYTLIDEIITSFKIARSTVAFSTGGAGTLHCRDTRGSHQRTPVCLNDSLAANESIAPAKGWKSDPAQSHLQAWAGVQESLGVTMASTSVTSQCHATGTTPKRASPRPRASRFHTNFFSLADGQETSPANRFAALRHQGVPRLAASGVGILHRACHK